MTIDNHQDSTEELTIHVPPFLRKWAQRVPKSLLRACLLFVAIGFGVGLGIQASMLAIKWYETGPIAPRDLGKFDFGAVGLRGHLRVRWEGQAEYQLVIEPLNRGRLAAFASLVGDPPRPLSFKLELRDAEGFVLCHRNVALRFNFTKRLAPPDNSLPYETRLRALFQYSEARSDAAAEQEKWDADNDIFHRDLAQNGTPGAISAEGQIPCSRSAFKQVSAWGFSTNFPTVSEQDTLAETRSEIKPQEESPILSNGTKRRNQATKSIKGTSPSVSREGYDIISGYSVIESKIETSGGLTFYVYKDGERENAISWGVDSAEIHYQCDANSLCTLTRSGTPVILHVRLERAR